MPAIQPDRLKQQAAELAQCFSDGEKFIRALNSLLGEYAERAIRPGQSGEPSPLLDKFGVPPPVLRYILLAVSPYVVTDPASAFSLCDQLWKEPNLEYRTLAIGLLGKIPTSEAGQVIERVEIWAQQESERRLILNLFEVGLAEIRKFHSALLLDLVQEWLQEPGLEKQKLGLMVLLSLANEPEYENLPIFFRLLTPLVVNIKAELRPELMDILLALARRSPPETAYFVTELLLIPNCQSAGWLARQLIPHLPEAVAVQLRQALTAASNQPTRPVIPRK